MDRGGEEEGRGGGGAHLEKEGYGADLPSQGAEGKEMGLGTHSSPEIKTSLNQGRALKETNGTAGQRRLGVNALQESATLS